MLCQICDRFCIDDLLQKYTVHKADGSFMPGNETYYLHHSHYINLFNQAVAGCSLCKHIYQELTHQVILQFNPAYFYRFRIQYGEEQLYLGHEALDPAEEPLSIVVSQKNSFGGIRRIARLELLKDRNSSTSVPKIVEARDVCEDPSSPECLALARGFLDTCLTSHLDCAAANWDNVLPTRVIDVGPADGSQNPRLLISNNKRGAWIALSYSWGGRSESVLNTETLQDFQHGIPLDRVPKTIRDAIIITRALDFRYLWIDALCIIQNSSEDFTRETVSMSRIYKDSTLTIAAACSVSSEDGFLKPRIMCPKWPLRLKSNVDEKPEQSFLRPFSFYESEPFSDSQLPTRGWILQETILSPRILSYTSREMVWNCSKQIRECGRSQAGNADAPGMPRIASLLRSHLRSLQPSAVPSYKHLQPRRSDTDRDMSNTFYTGWLEIITDYTGRNLTVPSDVLPALSGLAKEYPRAPDDEYCAGIWKSQLLPALYWSREDPCGGGIPDVKPAVESGLSEIPSWSWASIQGPKTTFSKGRDMILPGSIIDIQIIPRIDGDPFYDTKGGFIHISAPFVEIDDFKEWDQTASDDFLLDQNRNTFPGLNGLIRKEWRSNPAFRSEYRQKHVAFDRQTFGALMVGEQSEWSKVTVSSASEVKAKSWIKDFDPIEGWDEQFSPPGPFLFLILESVDEDLMDGFKRFRRVGIVYIDLKSYFTDLQANARNELRKPDKKNMRKDETFDEMMARLSGTVRKVLDAKANGFCTEMYEIRDVREESLILV